MLCPTLRQGDLVIMDNLTPHKSEPTLALIEAAGAQPLFLPAYSPDFNPIEKMWSKVKAHLRCAEARTRDTLQDAIAATLSKVTANDVIYFTGDHYSTDQNLYIADTPTLGSVASSPSSTTAGTPII